MSKPRDADIPRYDKKGRRIYPGDVLKVDHFVGPRNKKYYMYKIAHEMGDRLYAAHAHEIYKKGMTLENSYWLNPMSTPEDYEIVDGYNPVNFEQRERVKL